MDSQYILKEANEKPEMYSLSSQFAHGIVSVFGIKKAQNKKTVL